MFPTLHRLLHILSNTLAKFKLINFSSLFILFLFLCGVIHFWMYNTTFDLIMEFYLILIITIDIFHIKMCVLLFNHVSFFPREECFCILYSHNFLLFSKALKECSTSFQGESAKKNKHIFMKSVVIMSSGIPWVETLDRVISQQYKNTTLQTQWRNLRARAWRRASTWALRFCTGTSESVNRIAEKLGFL